MIRIWKECRICGSPLLPVMTLGDQYIAGYISDNKKFKFADRKVPLTLMRCDTSYSHKSCGLVQLAHTCPSFILYRDYFYRSAINETMANHLYELADKAMAPLSLAEGSIIVDIGANDGTLLKYIESLRDMQLIAFEPARNLMQYYIGSSIKGINNFFNARDFATVAGSQKAGLIFSIAMFYDLEDPKLFVEDISKVLADDGVWVLEQSYLPLMLQQNAYDTLCHEHLEYYSLHVLEQLFSRFGLKVIDAYLNDTNGGSIQLYVVKDCHVSTEDASERLYDLRLQEFEAGLDTSQPYEDFKSRVSHNCQKLKNFIRQEVGREKKIFAYGASTKGVVTLQACDLDNNLIKACADRNPMKCGSMIGGLEIPIISEEEARAQKPDYFLILPWHFKDNFIEREKKFLENGGKFIMPIPEFEIIGA